jgi:hypothetical protein
VSNIINSLVADKLVQTPANKLSNYWSLLSCLVEEQEEEDDEQVVAEHLLSILADIVKSKVKNKITEKWRQKVANRSGILDMG